MERIGCPGRDVLRDQPWKVGAEPGGRVDVVHCQELDGGVNDSLGSPRAAATEQRGQSDQIAPSAVTDGQLLPICPREKDTDDASADERDPWSRALRKMRSPAGTYAGSTIPSSTSSQTARLLSWTFSTNPR